MKDIIVIDSEVGLTKVDLIRLEKKLKLLLPDEYKSFLLLHNGGHPEKNCFPTININLSNANISWFYALYDGEYENLLREIQRYNDIIPEDFIPIGRSGGNEICLGIYGEDAGKLYFFVPGGYTDEDGIQVTNNMYLIANTFTDFINSLYHLDIEGKINEDGVYIMEKSIATHDKYSLPFSTHTKKYGSFVTDFFAQAPSEIEDYIIEDYETSKDIVLYYNVKPEGKRYKRTIKNDGQVTDNIEHL